MRVLIFEDVADGHHFVYVRHLVSALLERGARPVLATTHRAVQSAQFAELLGDFGAQLELSLFDEPPVTRMVLRHLWRSGQLIAQIRKVRPDHTLVPYVDGMGFVLPALAPAIRLARGRSGLDAVAMRVAPAEAAGALRTKHALLKSLVTLGVADRLHVIDEVSQAALLERAPRTVARRICLTPDPVLEVGATPSRETARAHLGLDPARRVVLCIGQLSRRKSVDRLLEVAASDDTPADVTLLLAGAATDEVRAQLADAEVAPLLASGRVVVHEGFVAAADFAAYFAAADVVTALYVDHHGSSGVVIQAASANRPLLASDEGWIGHVVERYGLGACCDPRDATSVAAALTKLLTGATAPDAEGRAAFLASRTLEAFTASLLRAIPSPEHAVAPAHS